MSKTRGCRFINLLLVLAFLTAGISPACQFISGKAASVSSTIEICTIYGVEKVAVSQGQGAGEEGPGHDDHQMQDQCLFCVASHLNKAASAASSSLPSQPVFARAFYSHKRPGLVAAGFYSRYQARAPPLSSLYI